MSATTLQFSAIQVRLSGFALRWILGVALFLTIMIWSQAINMPAQYPQALYGFVIILFVASVGARYVNLHAASDLLATFAVLGMFCPLINSLSCLVIASNAPFADTLFAKADIAIGFDWLSYWNWMGAHPRLHQVLAWVYGGVGYEVAGIAILLRLLDRTRDYERLVWGALLAALMAIIIAAPTPTLGASYLYGVQKPFWVDQILALRAHTGNVVASFGSICFPSFHTTLALLSTYAIRNVKWLVLPAVIFNVAMLFAIPTEGSHYLVDMIGGAAVACAAIMIAKRIEMFCAVKPPIA